jgi:DNA-binding transcriptional LysR family regulator
MELRYLRYFIAVAEDLSFSRASERLRVDQSALSRRIQDLEHELQTPLFTRTQHRVQLTAAGKAFLAEARRLMEDTETAINTARRAARGEVGQLDIGYITALSDALILRLLRLFRSRFPQVLVRLRNMRPAEQIAALLSGKIHLGFVGLKNPEYEVQLAFEVFRQDPMQVVLPSEHPLHKRKQVRLTDLSREKFVFLTRAGTPVYFDWLMKLCHQAGFQPDVVQEVETRQTAIELVAAGYGVALFPFTARPELHDFVAFRPVKDMPSYENSVAWHSNDESPTLAAFLNLLRAEVGAKAPASSESNPPGTKAFALANAPRSNRA